MPTLLLDAASGAVPRTSLRGAARDRVRGLIVAGRLPPRANVVERDLSAQLGVSRTPLREALLGLEAEGLLHTRPGRGFFVADLSVAEARELYPLIWTLEAMALRRGRPTDLRALRPRGAAFRAATSAGQALAGDRAWHEALINECRAPRTAAILEPLRVAAARYEYRYFSSRAAIVKSADQHDAIVRALQRRRYGEAARLLRRNWQQGLDWVERNFKAG